MQRITLEEFRDAIQESTAPLVDGRLIPTVDGQALEIVSGNGYTGTPTTFWLWSKDDLDKYKEELEAAHGIKENT